MERDQIQYNKTYRNLLITLWEDKLPMGWEIPSTLPAGVRLYVGQLECCPETGRRHYQVT